MDIKLIKKVPPTVYAAQLPCAPGRTDMDVPQVTIRLIGIDAHDVSLVLGRVVCSPAEARDLAERLKLAADAAEKG